MKKEKRKRVKIHEANHIIIFRGRGVRTPVSIDVTDEEFRSVMMIIQSRGILGYEVEDIIEKVKIDKDLVMQVPQEIDESVAVESFEGESTLKKLLDEK